MTDYDKRLRQPHACFCSLSTQTTYPFYVSMISRPSRNPDSLRIWQQNTRKSKTSHMELLNSARPEDWDIIAIQEPYLDALGTARGTNHWRVIYPSNHLNDGSSRPRSILLINTNIATDSYIPLDIPNSDITAVRFNGSHGFMSLFNVYNDCTHNDNLTALNVYLDTNSLIAKPSTSDHMIWLGDFNRHHPLWESHTNYHLNSSQNDIEPLLALLQDYEKDLVLPPGIPTLETSAGNWTRPDNVWRSHSDYDPVISCKVDPAGRPAKSDHLPIITILELPIARSSSSPSPDFHDTDYEDLNTRLKERLSQESPARHIQSKDEFHAKVDKLVETIQSVIAEKVPIKKPCPFSKRWWSKDLTKLRNAKYWLSNEAFKFRDIVDHPSKAALKQASNTFAEEIDKKTKEHWVNWLENIKPHEIYTANKYVVDEPSDYSSARVPTLKTRHNDGTPHLATTNLEKAGDLAKSFFPPPPVTTSVSADFKYPNPLPGVKFYSRRRIHRAISKLKPHKAPGPDGIPNVILVRCIDALLDHLYFIYRAVFELNVYHARWLALFTLVLRKIGKAAYDMSKSYRPIGLLDTIGKLLSTLIAADLSFLVEKYNLLPAMQFGGRSRHNTSDAMHILVHRIKDTWRSGKVASVLFLDVQGAFPNTVKDQLLHNMKSRRIPTCYVQLADLMLTGRSTRLRFDDFISDPIDINNGTTQGCPLSMIFYAFYNASLIETASNTNETALGFVDDCAFVAVAETLADSHKILKDMMERPNSGFDWSVSHNSPYELTKLAKMDFPRTRKDQASSNLSITRRNPNGSLTTQEVTNVNLYKYLGVVFEPNLRWSAHVEKVIATATWWSFQISCLSKVSGGMLAGMVRQLYNTVAVPAFTYAADIWYTGIHKSTSSSRWLGSVAVTSKLISVQRRAAKLVTGSLGTTAGDVLDVHANLLPVDLLFHKVLFRAAARIASLPPSHPLHSLSRKAANRYVKRHRSPLHNLFFTTKISPAKVENIDASRRHPNFVPAFSSHMKKSKPEALIEAIANHEKAPVSVYCDSSGFEGGIGASAVLFINGVEQNSLRYHLGSVFEHTVYEGEIVGLTLALHLLAGLRRQLKSLTVLGTDSQATILALDNQLPRSAHYLLDRVHDAAAKLHQQQDKLQNVKERREAKQKGIDWKARDRNVINLQLHWTPGHMDFPPNKRADEEAKLAAQGSSSNVNDLPAYLRRKPLPHSVSALRQEHTILLQKNWKRRWKTSSRYSSLRAIDRSLPSKKFMKLVRNLDRRQSAIIAQLRTNHIPLNHHLFRIHRSETPVCPHCQEFIVETVPHFLFACPHYQHERHILQQKLKRKASSKSFLLTNPEALKPLLHFVHATKRFNTEATSARHSPNLPATLNRLQSANARARRGSFHT